MRRGFAILALACLAAGGGPLLACRSRPSAQLPALRFAGVDLIYALRRVAAESGRILLLDETRPEIFRGDLFLARVDVDLQPGSVEDMLETLKEVTGRFDYRVEPDLIYVRSDAAVDQAMEIDARLLPAGRFKGDLKALGGFIRTYLPGSYIQTEAAVGQPVYTKVELDVPAQSSVLDVVTSYARVLNHGWRMLRAGYEIDPSEEMLPAEERRRKVYLSSTLTQWSDLRQPFKVYPGRNEESALRAMADIEARLGTTICVVDRSLLTRNRGQMDFWPGIDGKLDLETAFKELAGAPWHSTFRWRWWKEGVALVHSDLYDYADTGRDLLRQRVQGGKFHGSLPELGRWINTHRKTETQQVMMSGEITGKEKQIDLDIAEDWTVEELLLEFAARNGAGFVFVAQEDVKLGAPEGGTRVTGTAPPMGDVWAGGFLTYLSDWREPPDYVIAY